MPIIKKTRTFNYALTHQCLSTQIVVYILLDKITNRKRNNFSAQFFIKKYIGALLIPKKARGQY